MFFFWILTPYRLVGRYKVSDKRTASIFRAEVVILGSGGIYAESVET
jgi:hypothetical protein